MAPTRPSGQRETYLNVERLIILEVLEVTKIHIAYSTVLNFAYRVSTRANSSRRPNDSIR